VSGRDQPFPHHDGRPPGLGRNDSRRDEAHARGGGAPSGRDRPALR